MESNHLCSGRVLVYGASGLIGLNLLKVLSHRPEVTELVAISQRGVPIKFLELLQGDVSRIREYSSLDEADGKFEYIFHCGGTSQPSRFTGNPSKVVIENLFSIPALVSKLSRTGRIIYSSSTEIYNGCPDQPCTEDHRGIIEGTAARRIYTESKELSELAIFHFLNEEKSVSIARIAPVFGPGVYPDDARVLNQFVREGLAGEVVVRGNPEALRSYTYIDDFTRMFVSLSWLPPSTYNIGGDQRPVTMRSIAERIASLTKSRVLYADDRQTFEQNIGKAPLIVHTSMEKYLKLVQPEPPTSLEDGLASTVDWFRAVSNL